MKLWAEFSERPSKDEAMEFHSADINEVNHLLCCLTIYSCILFWIATFGLQMSLIAALLKYIGWLFGYLIVYTLNLIKEFYQVYCNIHIYTRVTDPSG